MKRPIVLLIGRYEHMDQCEEALAFHYKIIRLQKPKTIKESLLFNICFRKASIALVWYKEAGLVKTTYCRQKTVVLYPGNVTDTNTRHYYHQQYHDLVSYPYDKPGISALVNEYIPRIVRYRKLHRRNQLYIIRRRGIWGNLKHLVLWPYRFFMKLMR